MNTKQKILGVLLISLVVLNSGCVYLRLLQVKRQLKDFNNNFILSDEGGLTLIFKNPVLLENDIVWLMKDKPIDTQQSENGELWKYQLEKKYAEAKREEGDFDIPVSMFFQNDKLVKVIFPERFLKDLSIPLLKRMLSSMGKADIDKLNRQAESRFEGKNASEIPKKKYVLNVLGVPYENKTKEGVTDFIYVYTFKKNDNQSTNKKSELKINFSFENTQDRLERAEFNLNGLGFSLNFSVDDNDTKM